MRENVRTCFHVLVLTALFMQLQQNQACATINNLGNSTSSEKIAVAAVGDSINSEISAVAGRAPFYLIFNEKGVLLKSIKNPAQNQRGGASSIVVHLLKEESVTIFIAGKFGNKMIGQLKANRIIYFERTGTAEKTVKKMLKTMREKDEQP
jgi:predicted Fe-Mo cluster-binding NifX family protein